MIRDTLKKSLLAGSCLVLSGTAAADQLTRGAAALHSMAGCYLVDYSYAETTSLKPGYIRDARVYDVNTNRSIKEWIYAVDVSAKRIRLQHILFGTELDGTLMEGSMLKHQVEDWELDAPFLYEFTAPLHWSVKELGATPGLWTRRITNLDDGLRYQCAAAWSETTAYPEWACDNFAPIPGRETRDMGRRDYNTLDRGTRIVAYSGNWLERQTNVKTILDGGVKTPLAKELGKNWYVRLPDAECAPAQAYAQPLQAFWDVLREAWDEVYTGDRPFVEKTLAGRSRYGEIVALEAQYASQNLNDPTVRAAARKAILDVIEAFREN